MTHEEFDEINETLQVACDDALFYARDVIGGDAIILGGQYKGRKGQIIDTRTDDGRVLLVVQPYREAEGIVTDYILSITLYLNIEAVLLCDDKLRYAKYLLTS